MERKNNHSVLKHRFEEELKKYLLKTDNYTNIIGFIESIKENYKDNNFLQTFKNELNNNYNNYNITNAEKVRIFMSKGYIFTLQDQQLIKDFLYFFNPDYEFLGRIETLEKQNVELEKEVVEIKNILHAHTPYFERNDEYHK